MNSSSVNRSESELVGEILNGEREKYRLLVDRFSPMIFHIVRRFEKDDDEVEELAQQIFVKAYEKLETYNSKSAFSTWLYTLALNHCRDYARNIRRTHQRFSELDEALLEETLSNPEMTPYADITGNEWKQLLKQALQDLKREYSEPFLLKYRDGISYDVMSELTGVSVSALKVRVHRARKELKTYIEQNQ